MDRFVQSCDAFVNYPQNLVHHDMLEHSLEAYHARLNGQAHRLFCFEDKSALDFLDLNEGEKGSRYPHLLDMKARLLTRLCLLCEQSFALAA
jgi:hypothetical protein